MLWSLVSLCLAGRSLDQSKAAGPEGWGNAALPPTGQAGDAALPPTGQAGDTPQGPQGL